MQLVRPLQALSMEGEDDLHSMSLSLGSEEDDGATRSEGACTEGNEKSLTRSLAGAEASLDRLARLVSAHSKDCELEQISFTVSAVRY